MLFDQEKAPWRSPAMRRLQQARASVHPEAAHKLPNIPVAVASVATCFLFFQKQTLAKQASMVMRPFRSLSRMLKDFSQELRWRVVAPLTHDKQERTPGALRGKGNRLQNK